MRRPLVAGNWKMNGTRARARELVQGIVARLPGAPDAEILVCPPYVYLAEVAELLAGSPVALGAQDAAREAPGAYTGEVAAQMLADVGCTHVLVGHSERRQRYAESDAVVAEKFARALEAGLTPVLCLGESLAEREAASTETVVARQLDAILEAAGVQALGRAVLAYEPVWAIGTGRTATPEQAQEVHAFLRARVAASDARIGENLRILYGGSVKSANARELFEMADVDGGLVGGASLDAEEFVGICRAAA